MNLTAYRPISPATHTVAVSKISPGLASTILAKNNFAEQRKLNTNHVAYLADSLQANQFDGGSPIRFAEFAGSRYLIDGQHRLTMLTNTGKTVEFVVVTTHCASLDEVAHLYARIDRGRGRSVTDALRALGLYITDDLSSGQMKALISCMPLIAGGLKQSVSGSAYYSKSAEHRSELAEKWRSHAIKFFDAIAETSNAKSFLKREIVLVGMVTMADAPERMRAAEFWRGAARDDGLAADDPRKAMLEFVRRNTPTASGIGYFGHGVVAAWNAWAEGRKLRVIKPGDITQTIKPRGTRWERGIID